MRKITRETARNFKDCQTCKRSNVVIDWGVNGHLYYYLHNNLIADYNPKANTLTIEDAGRKTNTTKERLNGILDAFGLLGIYQKNFERFFEN